MINVARRRAIRRRSAAAGTMRVRRRVGRVTDLDARPPHGAPVLERRAARALVVDAADRVLLFHGLDPTEPERGRWWFTPGGGLEGAEDLSAGLVREVREETGLQLDPGDVAPPVWTRTSEFLFAGEWYRQQEWFFLVRVATHTVDTTGFVPLEASAIIGHRWWSVAELATTDEVVYPPAFGVELNRLLTDGPSDRPRVVG